MRMGIALTLIALAGFLPGRALAASAAGANPLNFLFLDADARAVALGGAYTAVAADGNALNYNPAGLGGVRGSDVVFMHNRMFENASQNYAGLALSSGFGAMINYVDFGETRRTTISNPDGTGLDDVGANDWALSFGYGRRLWQPFMAGVGVKFIRETIDGTRAQGIAVDLGAIYEISGIPGLRFGAAVQNLGPEVKFQSAKENLPLNFRMGAAYSFEISALAASRNLLAFDVSKEREGKVLFAGGVESVLAGLMAFRAGFTTRNDAGLGVTGGVGWVHENWRLDYAFVPFGDLGTAHRVSIGYSWGGDHENTSRHRKRREPRSPRGATRESGGVDDAAKARSTYQEAVALIGQGDYNAALKKLYTAETFMSKRERLRIRVYDKRGYALYKIEDYDGARESYERALRLATSLDLGQTVVADAYAGMGMCFWKLGEVDKAEKVFQKALETGPSSRTRKFIQLQLKKLRSSGP